MLPQNHHAFRATSAPLYPQAAGAFAEAVHSIPQLQLTGEPESCVVGLMATAAAAREGFNVYALNDMLKARGWHLSALQHPPALHMCFTAAHAHVAANLVKVRQVSLCA